MRLGIIDLGTNSVRFDVHEIKERGEVTLLHREKLMVRLGQGVFISAKLDPDAKLRTLQAFMSFKRTARELAVDRITAFGTSALRESTDGASFVRQIVRRTGIDLRIIPGDEEARLIALGVLKNDHRAKGRYALIDIGGGSTEISICKGKKVLHSQSFELGTARLHQVFLKASPPRERVGEPSPVKRLRKHIRETLQAVMVPEKWQSTARAIGSSGTIRAIEKIEARRQDLNKLPKGFTRTQLENWVKEIEPMTTTELLSIPGMEAKRVDMFLAGSVLLEEVLRQLKAKRVLATDFSLRDGILEEEKSRMVRARSASAHRQGSLRINPEELKKKALKLGAHPQHLEQVTTLALRLYDLLQKLHKLPREWREVLHGACHLHDIGESVNPVDHGEHGAYIIKEAHFPGMDEHTEAIVMELVRYHSGGKIETDSIPFWKAKRDREGFLKLLSILRLADALDRGHRQPISIRSISITRSEVILHLSSRVAIDLECLRVEQKRELFEDVFGRSIVLKKGRRGSFR